MDVFEAIRTRRSVRTLVTQDVVDTLLDAGRMAPTAGNMQPWEFIVVRDKERKQAIIETTFVGFDPNSVHKQRWMGPAPVFIVVCTNYKSSCTRHGEKKGTELALMDASAAVENILIAAAGLGLGACWVSGFHKDKLSALLKLPDMIEPTAIIPVGHAQKLPKSPAKFGLEEVTHFEEYGNTGPETS